MAVAKITKREVDGRHADAAPVVVMDTEVKGFGLKVTPQGRKVYFLQYRLGGRDTPTQRFTIGRHGSPWTAEAAREEALRLRGQVAAGVDICGKRREAKSDAQ